MSAVAVGFALTAAAGAAQDQAKAITVEGCLLREADVPGRKPNVAERAGITDDYILTASKMIKGNAPGAAPAARPDDTPTGTAGATRSMYEVEGIDEATLLKHVNQRVQIDGVFEHTERASNTSPSGELVQIKGVAIRQVPGECATK
jgi:hypothetical protein